MFAHLICLLEGALISADFRTNMRPEFHEDDFAIGILDVNDWHLRAISLGWVPSGQGWVS